MQSAPEKRPSITSGVGQMADIGQMQNYLADLRNPLALVHLRWNNPINNYKAILYVKYIIPTSIMRHHMPGLRMDL